MKPVGVSMTATLEPGLRGPEAEALPAGRGLTLGHHSQSFEHASVGGFAATRSSGQSSAGYGRFDAMVVGLIEATPAGRLDMGTARAGAVGPAVAAVVSGLGGTPLGEEPGRASVGVQVLRAGKDSLDPTGVLNPGVLVP
ncbi:FAD-binding protein [uncultured Nocardioides sp.]|uniref:FAD-binding protein n=1 Tax=uncultured Nocardioides sp. TaxID=198441 RepID=UPI0025FB4328|nr:FAD-binding protein [uncultured Nocardioides sp.]